MLVVEVESAAIEAMSITSIVSFPGVTVDGANVESDVGFVDMVAARLDVDDMNKGDGD